MSDDQVRAAEFEVDRARSKLLATLQQLSQQFQPHRLMQEAWEKAKDKGADIAEDAVDAVRARPVTASAVAAGIVAFLARGPLVNLAGKLVHSAKSKTGKRRKSPPQKSKTEASE
jgi:ElaB/YqjD/DUF883 family membrane-anchored ribosome-binding protein